MGNNGVIVTARLVETAQPLQVGFKRHRIEDRPRRPKLIPGTRLGQNLVAHLSLGNQFVARYDNLIDAPFFSVIELGERNGIDWIIAEKAEEPKTQNYQSGSHRKCPL